MPALAPPTIGIFAPEALRRHVDAALASIPEGKATIVLGYYDLSGAWRAGFAWRDPGGVWTFSATVGQDLAAGNVKGGLTGGVVVRGVW